MINNTSVATVTTLKAPLEETLSFIHYYLNSGIDRMYLFFDDPDDPAISQIEHDERLTIYRCDEAHWSDFGISSESTIQDKQEKNATLAFQMAGKSGIEWLLHVDHDELIYGPGSLKGYFSTVPSEIEILRFPVMEAIPQQDAYTNAFAEISLFKVYDALPVSDDRFFTSPKNKAIQYEKAKWWYRRRKVADLLGSNHAKYHTGRIFLHGHQVGKSATRTSAKISSIKCHLPEPAEHSVPEMKVSERFYVLHYDCMGFESWKNKWTSRLTGASNFDTRQFSAYRNSILEDFKKHSDEGSLLDLYKNFYHLNSFEKFLLRSTGLLKKIRHNPALFKIDSTK
ncbi:glycosyltransferase family 2 protein [Rhodohalobacter sp. 8-1]|uniref:glycosyltransferase family 2 protein n=1 Tax=Rhodohalobacter sp. 8-1 TaxID=3131972 RepID=UPI0030EE30F5